MSTIELKNDLHLIIDKISDSSILKTIHKLLKSHLRDDIVGYEANGKPITKKAFIKRIEKAEADIKKGNFVTIEELEKESENW